MMTTLQKTKTPGWFSEPKNIATTIVGLSLIAWPGLWLSHVCIAMAGSGYMDNDQPDYRWCNTGLFTDDSYQS
jgi:hypothetical protein